MTMFETAQLLITHLDNSMYCYDLWYTANGVEVYCIDSQGRMVDFIIHSNLDIEKIYKGVRNG